MLLDLYALTWVDGEGVGDDFFYYTVASLTDEQYDRATNGYYCF